MDGRPTDPSGQARWLVDRGERLELGFQQALREGQVPPVECSTWNSLTGRRPGEGAAPRRRDVPVGELRGRAPAVVSANSRPPGRTRRGGGPATSAAPASHARWRCRTPKTSPGHRPCERLAAGHADRGRGRRSRAPESHPGGTPPSSGPIDQLDHKDVSAEQGERNSGQAPRLPTSTTRAGWSSLCASANASGKCSADQRLNQSRGRRVDARVEAQQQLRHKPTGER